MKNLTKLMNTFTLWCVKQKHIKIKRRYENNIYLM